LNAEHQTNVEGGEHMKTFMDAGRIVLACWFAVGSIVFYHGQADAQEKHRYSFKTPPGVAKYTQQHVIDVGDVPGHQVRIYEIQTKYTAEAPAYDGVKVVEVWTRGISDYTNGSGHAQNYAVNLMANGDKIFSHSEILTHTLVNADGSRASKFTTVVTLTGGTGKFKGIRGTLRSAGQTDFKIGTSGVEAEGEYWFEK